MLLSCDSVFFVVAVKHSQSFSGDQFDFVRLAGGTIPLIRKYSTICP